MKINKEQLDNILDNADALAVENGYENTKDLMEDTTAKIKSKVRATSEKAHARAVEFTNQLTMLILSQQLENMGEYQGIYKWVNSFDDGYLNEGNTKQYNLMLTGKHKWYDENEYIANRTTKEYGENTTISFLKQDGTLSSTAYQFRKSTVLLSQKWFVYFMNGNLGKYLTMILEEAQRVYSLFKAYTVQQLIKGVCSGGAQVPSAQKGENGKSLKALVHNSQASDTYEATIELISLLYDMKEDCTNKYCLANDSNNLKPLSTGEYIIFAPKKYISTFYSSILSRLPSAGLFNNEILSSADIIPIGRELKNTYDVNQEGVIETLDAPFLPEDTIVILSKNAIKHILTLRQNANQFYAANLANQNEIHVWGVFGLIPWEKALVFKCPNLLVKP